MTKQTKLEQVISEAVKPYLVRAIHSGFETAILEALASEGVVRKVDRELPKGGKCYGEHSIYEVPDIREEIVFHTQQDMLLAGWGFFGPLIGEEC